MVSTRLSSSPPPDCIRLRGVRQNNLKGFDLDVPLGRYVVVTGLSGAGKSSLVFDTLHAEGQRRYVETFSAYTRQFLDLLDKPKVDSIENIRPSIAIEQSNTVKTSRSTVGTMTELTDFFKVWFSHVARCFDPITGKEVVDDNPQTIWEKTVAAHGGETAIVAFKIAKPENLRWDEILKNLKTQTYVRVLVPAISTASPDRTGRPSGQLIVYRIDESIGRAFSKPSRQRSISAAGKSISSRRVIIIRSDIFRAGCIRRKQVELFARRRLLCFHSIRRWAHVRNAVVSAG